MSGEGGASRRLLTFRLDQEQRQRLKARLTREGRTMSEVVTHGLRQYVQHGGGPGGGAKPLAAASAPGGPVLPERIAARLRELRSSGRNELLSATLAALSEAGWPLRPLADALGVSRQAVQARVRRRVPAELRHHVTNCEPPPPFPHRRVASANGLRPHLTIKIDRTLRAAAHRAAAYEGSSLSQVVEAILDRYLRHGMADGDKRGTADGGKRKKADGGKHGRAKGGKRGMADGGKHGRAKRGKRGMADGGKPARPARRSR
jgi:antitoxin component of RelBE/YafQ-DinJ toxin-antitoxin module